MKLVISALSILVLSSFIWLNGRKTKVWLVGDSTCANKEIKAFPETGWGMPFAYFFDSTIEVDNRAKNGRSTKSFRVEGLWKSVVDNLAMGDYVFIQFGHNDEAKEKKERYSSPEDFKTNLLLYVTETKAKGAIPVLLTPVARRKFDATGIIIESHPVYADIVRDVAKQTGVSLIDLDAKSMTLLQTFGPVYSKLLYNHLDSLEHPNYPNGKKDDTHFSEFGARRIAEIVLAEIKAQKFGLAAHIYAPPVKK